MSDLSINSVKHEPVDGVKVSEVFRSVSDVKFSPSMSDKQCLVAARAISNYDSNQELIAKQAEQIELLNKGKVELIESHINRLIEVITHEPVPEFGYKHNLMMRDAIITVMRASVKALEATAKG